MTAAPSDEEVVRGVLRGLGRDAVAEGTPDLFVERLDPEIEFEEDPRFPEGGVYRGRDAVLGYFKQFAGALEEFRFEVVDVVKAGDGLVVVDLRISGRGRGSGAEFDSRPAWHYVVRDGRVVRIRAYLDRAEAFEAAGLRP